MQQLSWIERELELAGYRAEDAEDRPSKWLREGVLELLEVFNKQGHSGFSAPYAISIFTRLASHKPLTPLTGDDSEWGTESSPDQNNRFSSVFRDVDGNASWSSGIVFWEWFVDLDTGEKSKSYFTCSDSVVGVSFPFTVPDEPEYRERIV